METQAPAKSPIGKYVMFGLLAIVVFLAFGLRGFYQSMVSMDESIKSLDAQIGNMYDRRSDVMSQIGQLIKAANEFEGGTLKDITELRGASQNFAKLEALQKEGKIASADFTALLASTMSGLKVMQENYPQLQSVGLYKDAFPMVEGSENRLRVAIKDYNDQIALFNTELRSFPYGIIASNFLGFSYKDRTYGETPKNQDANRAVPDIGKMLAPSPAK